MWDLQDPLFFLGFAVPCISAVAAHLLHLVLVPLFVDDFW